MSYPMPGTVRVDDGNGWFDIDDWTELWTCMWRAVAYSIRFDAAGGCAGCGCEIRECRYCIHECYVLS